MTQSSFFKYLDPPFPTNKPAADGRKLRGGYYTPLELAHYLVRWGIREDTQRILEPSCGDGNFILALLQHLQASPNLTSTIVAVELKIVLKNYLGFDNLMVQKIRSAWEQLRDRRVERK